MKRIKIFLVYMIFQTICFSQSSEIEKLGFRNFGFVYKDEDVSILLQSKKGDENTIKPVIIYFQGSLGRPLIINYPQKNNYKRILAFPFNTEKILEKYHIAVISKPFVPIIVNAANLDEDYNYVDSVSKKIPINFLKNDNLGYLVNRNIQVIQFVKKLSFIDKKKIIVLGHSEGSRVGFEVMEKCKHVSHLIYLSGNPFGRYMNMTNRKRESQDSKDFLKKDDVFDFWKEVLQNKNTDNFEDGGDTYKSWFTYSEPYFEEFLKIKKPVFIGYGTKDNTSPFNDLFYFYTLLENKKNFFIKPYVGLEHSFYQVNDDKSINHKISYWDVVVEDVLKWLDQN